MITTRVFLAFLFAGLLLAAHALSPQNHFGPVEEPTTIAPDTKATSVKWR